MALSTSRDASINVTPLIDVLLVLLIIFMVVAPTRPAQFEAQVPAKPRDGASAPDDGPLVVTLGADQSIRLGDELLTLGELEAHLTSHLAGRADRTVILKAPRSAPYASVVAVIDRVSGSGAAPLGLQVDLLDV